MKELIKFPSYPYRLLKTNEIIEAGDKYYLTGTRTWATCFSSIGKTPESFMFPFIIRPSKKDFEKIP